MSDHTHPFYTIERPFAAAALYLAPFIASTDVAYYSALFRGLSSIPGLSMDPLAVLVLWIAAHALHVGLGAAAIRQHAKDQEPCRLGSLVVSLFGSILPWTTFVLFLMVFVIGGSSNVAQLAGDSGHELWSVWLGWWPLLFFGNPIAVVVLAVTALCPPYPPRHANSFAARLCSVAGAALAWYAVVRWFPDA